MPPRQSHRRREKPETGEYRASIDAGRTGDKVPVEDPAAAPFHTDSEAAGEPIERAAAARAQRRQESWADEAWPDREARAKRRGGSWLVAALGVLVILGAAAAVVSL